MVAFQVIGKPVPRPDGVDKVTGRSATLLTIEEEAGIKIE